MTCNFTCPSKYLPSDAWNSALHKYSVLDENADANTDANWTEDQYEPFGYLPLRQALSGYIERTRGLCVSADRIIFFSRTLQPLNLIARLLVSEGTIVAMENPGFTFAGQTFISQGARIEPITVDENGMQVERILQLASAPKFAFVSPSHQNPTGVLLSAPRREKLLQWACENESFIIEDDSDCEHHYNGSNLPSIASNDTTNSVIYVNSFWKTLAPLVDASYLIVPEVLKDQMTKLLEVSPADANTVLPLNEQMTLCDLLNEGHLEDQIKANKPKLHDTFRALEAAFEGHFGSKFEFSKEPSGLHILIKFKTTKMDHEFIEAAERVGLPLHATTDYYFEHVPTREYLIPFAELEAASCNYLIGNFFQQLHK